MFAIFLFIVVFSFYCYISNDMQENGVKSASNTKADQNQELEQAVVAPESFVSSPYQNKEKVSTEPISKLTDDNAGVSLAETLPDMADPWTLPVDEDVAVVAPDNYNTQQQKSLLLLPPALEVVAEESALSHSTKSKLDEFLTEVNLEKLQLRPARKIASMLGIAQKVNGKDQPLSFLRSQIKSKLQQWQSLPPETVDIVQQLLAS